MRLCWNVYSAMYTVFQKTTPLIFGNNFGNEDRLLRFCQCHWHIPREIVYVSVIDFHLILTTLLHYLVKFENLE